MTLFDNPLEPVFTWWIGNVYTSLHPSREEVLRQTLYLYYSRRKDLGGLILRALDEMNENGQLIDDLELEAFRRDPNGNQHLFSEVIDNFDVGADLLGEMTEQYSWLQVAEITGWTIGNRKKMIKNYDVVCEFYNQQTASYPKIDIYTSVRKDMVSDAYQGLMSVDLFRLNASIKSIIGRRNFNATTKNVIVMRMIGAKSNAVLQEMLREEAVRLEYNNLMVRYRFDKLIDKWLYAGFGSKIGVKRKLFVSTKYSTDELRDAIITRITKRVDVKNAEAQARRLILRISAGRQKLAS